MIVLIFLISIAALCNIMMDEISHYDMWKWLGHFFSRDAYENSKYQFKTAHPYVPGWVVDSLLIIVLDAWHMCKMIMILCFCGCIATFSIKAGVICFCIYQIIFNLFYRK